MLFENIVCDVSNFKYRHPGGGALIKDNIGRDIGKFIYGAYSYNRTYRNHTHSNQAIKAIRDLAIARLEQNEVLINSVVGKNSWVI